MADLHKIRLTKADLDKIPSDERAFYLMAGMLANDISVLGKLLIFAGNGRRDDKPRKWAAMAQALLLTKLFAGRLFEGHLLMGKLFSAKKLREKYLAELHVEGTECLDKMNRYFGAKNAIGLVRNKFAANGD